MVSVKCCKDSKTVLRIEIRLTFHDLCDSYIYGAGAGPVLVPPHSGHRLCIVLYRVPGCSLVYMSLLEYCPGSHRISTVLDVVPCYLLYVVTGYGRTSISYCSALQCSGLCPNGFKQLLMNSYIRDGKL